MASVFYSWQSDRPSRENRSLISAALELAIEGLNAEVSDAERPDDQVQLDHDTKGLPGSPEIASAILAKIDVAAAFIADVTPIVVARAEGKRPARQVANPNVLIELGYAKKAIGPDKIIQVWNTAYTDCRPEHLPFDMRGRRGPISYRLIPGASKQERDSKVAELANALQLALKAVLAVSQSSPKPDRWQPADPNDPSIWQTDSGSMLINEIDHGSGTKRVFPPPRSYVRILPQTWTGSDDTDRHDMLLGTLGGFSWGATRGGIVTYPGMVSLREFEKVHAITKRFFGTGELWATRTNISGKHNDVMYLYGDDSVIGEWATFLRYAVPHILTGGGSPPLKIRLGVAGLGGLHWPNQTRYGGPTVALEDSFESEFDLKTGETDEIYDALIRSANKLRKVFSEPELSPPQEKGVMYRLRQ